MQSRSTFPVRTLLSLILALLLAACGDATGGGGGPGGTPPLPMSLNVAATGQVTAGQPALVYGTRIASGAKFRLYFQARSGRAADTLVADVSRGGTVYATVVSVAVENVGWSRSGEITIPGLDSVVVRVRGQGADDAGPFAVAVVTEDPRPEHAPRQVSLGQVIEGERLDVPGDVDEFRIEEARAGDEVLVFLEWLEIPLFTGVSVADSAGGSTIRQGAPVDIDSPTSGITTGRFTLSGAGPFLVRVGGTEATGPYRLHVRRIDRAPEAIPAALPAGAVTAVETIGFPGDVDEYAITGIQGQRVSLLMQLVSGLSGGVRLDVVRGNELLSASEATTPGATTEDGGIGYWVFPETGTYTVRVMGPDRAPLPASTGSYRLEVANVDPRPETAPGALTVGQPVTTESIDRAGDVDEFTFSAAVGERVVISIRSPASPAPILHAALVDRNGHGSGTASTAADGAGAGYLYGNPLTITEPGPHRVLVKAPTHARLARGPYRLEVHFINSAPESRGAAVTPPRPAF